MKSMVCFFVLLSLSNCMKAQSTSDSVIASVNRLFNAMKMADTVLLKSCFSPNAVFHTIRNSNGIVKVVEEDVAGFIQFVGKEKIGAVDEQIILETIKIDGPLAVVWTPYKFYYNGKFSHCGVNAFQLVRLEGAWKIQSIIDTRRKEGCQ